MHESAGRKMVLGGSWPARSSLHCSLVSFLRGKESREVGCLLKKQGIRHAMWVAIIHRVWLMIADVPGLPTCVQ